MDKKKGGRGKKVIQWETPPYSLELALTYMYSWNKPNRLLSQFINNIVIKRAPSVPEGNDLFNLT